MPNRIIREGILDSEAVNQLSLRAENLYRRLMHVVDDHGRFDGRLEILRARLYSLQLDEWPLEIVGAALRECAETITLAGEPLVLLYEVKGRPYVQINNFGQRVRSESKFPDPPVEEPRPQVTETIDVDNCPQMPALVRPTRARPRASRAHSESESEAYAESETEAGEIALARDIDPPERSPPKKIPKPEPERTPFGEFGRALLSRFEFEKLEQRLGAEATAAYIARFDRWVEEAPDAKANGVKRKARNAYPTILSWHDRDQSEGRKAPARGGPETDERSRAFRETERRLRDDRDAIREALESEAGADLGGPLRLPGVVPGVR